MNFGTSLCQRLNIKHLISSSPVCNSASDVTGEGLSLMFRRWATKRAAGSSKNGRDSNPKNLGAKKYGGERVIPGNIIVRQKGTRFHPGNYVGLGKDHTLFALKEGTVKFEKNKLSGRKWVHIEPKDGHVLHPIYENTAAAEMLEGSLRPSFAKMVDEIRFLSCFCLMNNCDSLPTKLVSFSSDVEGFS